MINGGWTGNFVGISAIFMWGTLGLLGKLSEGLPPEFILTICFGVAGLVGVVVCVFTGRKFTAISIPKLLFFVFLLTGYHLLYFTSFKYAPAVHVSLINYLWPAFLILFGNLFFGLSSGIYGYVGVILGFAGISVLMVGDTIFEYESTAPLGYLLAISGALIWAIYSNLRRMDRTDSIYSMTIICLLSSVVCAVAVLVNGSTPSNISFTEILVILFLAFGPAGGAFFLWDFGLRRGNATTLAVLAYSAPIISTILLIVFGYATASWNVLGAALLITVGGVVVNVRSR